MVLRRLKRCSGVSVLLAQQQEALEITPVLIRRCGRPWMCGVPGVCIRSFDASQSPKQMLLRRLKPCRSRAWRVSCFLHHSFAADRRAGIRMMAGNRRKKKDRKSPSPVCTPTMLQKRVVWRTMLSSAQRTKCTGEHMLAIFIPLEVRHGFYPCIRGWLGTWSGPGPVSGAGSGSRGCG